MGLGTAQHKPNPTQTDLEQGENTAGSDLQRFGCYLGGYGVL